VNARSGVFAPLAGAEYDCAIRAIVNAGHEPAKFVLEERCAEVQLAGGTSHRYKLVSVRRLTAGHQRLYNTGARGEWPFEFERDLETGIYGKEAVSDSV
jgi:hypothetical protein